MGSDELKEGLNRNTPSPLSNVVIEEFKGYDQSDIY
jgi:hypothetical protein